MNNLGSYCLHILIAGCAVFALLVTAADNLPAHSEPVPSCSCAGKGADCKTAVFDVDGSGEVKAYCAIWSERESCCLVGRAD